MERIMWMKVNMRNALTEAMTVVIWIMTTLGMAIAAIIVRVMRPTSV